MINDIARVGLGFLEGISLIASPCVLPILPIVLSASITGSKLRPVGIIIGFAVAFTAFTLLSRQLVLSLGIDPGLLRQISFYLLLAFGLILFSDKLSDWFASLTQNIGQWGANANQSIQTRSELVTGLLVGGCIGLIWVPCSGPILASVLVQSIQQHTSLYGFLTVFAFAIGAGIPMLLFALFGKRLLGQLKVLREHSHWIRKATGAIIIATVLFSLLEGSLPGFGPSSAQAAIPASVANVALEEGLPNPYFAPAFTGLQGWINSPAINIADLKGKVVLVDFWTYSCINCIRTLPHITAWDAKYRKDGLVVIGIHAPEFEFEKNANNVKRAVSKFGIRYPVALDNTLSTWTAFQNQYWPAHYLIDKTGRVVYTHFGEGEYDRTERNIRKLLDAKGPAVEAHDFGLPFQLGQTPETYMGYSRAQNFANRDQQTSFGKPGVFTFPKTLDNNHWALNGSWTLKPELIQAEQANTALRLKFSARDVHLVLGTASGKAIPVQILLDGKKIGPPLQVKEHRLYTLLHLKRFATGVVELQALTPGLQAYAFTFGA